VIIENRHGLVVAACATQSSTTAEREAALAMLDKMARIPTAAGPKPITLGADKLYQEEKFIEGLRQRKIAPHVAEYEKASLHWPNFLNQAERNDAGFAISQKKRKLVERVFGWGKLDSIMRKFKLRGVERIDWLFRLLATANNLVRMVKLRKLIPAQYARGKVCLRAAKEFRQRAKCHAGASLNSEKMALARSNHENKRIFQQPLKPSC
jgi:hypothetical protein